MKNESKVRKIARQMHDDRWGKPKTDPGSSEPMSKARWIAAKYHHNHYGGKDPGDYVPIEETPDENT